MALQITEQSKQLFIAYVQDAPNWNGTPMIGGNVSILGEKEDRGNLPQLKRAKLITTFSDNGGRYVSFTVEGKAYAAELGLASCLD